MAERIKAFDIALSTRLRDATHELPDVVPGSSFFLEEITKKMASQLHASPSMLRERGSQDRRLVFLLTCYEIGDQNIL